MQVAREHSYTAWETAIPIIEEEATKGKPYIPWAARPTDLPQAEIPAFPGAEGGYPEYKGEAYIDTDKDGMPDSWEKKYAHLGLNPNNPKDASFDCNGDGYTNIEKYINGIDPTQQVDWSNLENNEDTLTKKGGVQ